MVLNGHAFGKISLFSAAQEVFLLSMILFTKMLETGSLLIAHRIGASPVLMLDLAWL
jgi:hypothetical protein